MVYLNVCHQCLSEDLETWCLKLAVVKSRSDRQPILGVHMLSMTHREAAIFNDACTVPTPFLLLPGQK